MKPIYTFYIQLNSNENFKNKSPFWFASTGMAVTIPKKKGEKTAEKTRVG